MVSIRAFSKTATPPPFFCLICLFSERKNGHFLPRSLIWAIWNIKWEILPPQHIQVLFWISTRPPPSLAINLFNLLIYFLRKNGHFLYLFLNLGSFKDKNGKFYRPNTSRRFFTLQSLTNAILGTKIKILDISHKWELCLRSLSVYLLHLVWTSASISYQNNIQYQLRHFQKKPPPIAITLYNSLEKTEIFSTPSLIWAISRIKVENFTGPIHPLAFLCKNPLKT